MQTSRLLSHSPNSPSFDSFSSSAVDLAAIAARVVEELRDHEPQSDHHRDEDDDNFEFDCPIRRFSHPIATADEIFYDGKIRPLNPYGGGTGNAPVSPPKSTLPRRRRPALRKLMSEERGPTSEEDLTCVPPETYCVWTPKGGGDAGDDDDDLQELSSSPSQSKTKSSSAGFSKRWKLRNILYARSGIEGNGETNSDHREEEGEPPSSKVVGEEREGTKRQTFVPFNKDMMGILKNVNGLSRHLRPF